jgi:TRAP-type C4-dicarboxylate transport system permease small subunit
MMNRWSRALGQVYEALAWMACAMLFALMLVICADVFLRNVPLIPGLRGMPATNDLSEAFLYLITLFAGPWLLRLGQHIRVDILLRAIPPLWAWYCEWAVDVLGLLCSLVIAWYGLTTTWDSLQTGEMFIKALTTPVWWWLAFLPLTFGLLAVEFVFRMHRLMHGERAPREEAVSAS